MANPKITTAEFFASLRAEDYGPKKRGRKSRCPDREELDYIYNEKEVRVEKIAEYYGVKKITVYKWLSKYGLTRNTKGKEEEI